ncbi:9452_t:CDS:2, partial [Ambispora leptoticha]
LSEILIQGFQAQFFVISYKVYSENHFDKGYGKVHRVGVFLSSHSTSFPLNSLSNLADGKPSNMAKLIYKRKDLKVKLLALRITASEWILASALWILRKPETSTIN